MKNNLTTGKQPGAQLSSDAKSQDAERELAERFSQEYSLENFLRVTEQIGSALSSPQELAHFQAMLG